MTVAPRGEGDFLRCQSADYRELSNSRRPNFADSVRNNAIPIDIINYCASMRLEKHCPSPTKAGIHVEGQQLALLDEGLSVRDTYQVERFLGEGAFAEVYRALQSVHSAAVN
jgi:tRNA uridine 5-carbamoylmethylation protein Kti12